VFFFFFLIVFFSFLVKILKNKVFQVRLVFVFFFFFLILKDYIQIEGSERSGARLRGEME